MFVSFLLAIAPCFAQQPAEAEIPVLSEAPPVDPAACEQMGDLKKKAMMGKLTAEQIACLEMRLLKSDSFDRQAISATLLSDAHGKGDETRWAALAARHLTWIDGTDAAIAAKYASWLQEDAGRPDEAIHWVEVALENDYQFEEDTRDDRLFTLHGIRARAEEALWKKAQTTAATSTDPKDRMELLAAQGRVRLRSVEWMQHARLAGRSTTEAFTLCVSTGWTEERCAEEMAKEP